MRYASLIIIMILSGLLNACTLIPSYERPAAPIDASWPQGVAYPPNVEETEEADEADEADETDEEDEDDETASAGDVAGDARVAGQQAASGESARSPNAATIVGWKTFYRDPALQRLITLALENNRDLRVTALRVEAYRAQYSIQRADLLPTINVEGKGIRQRTPTDLTVHKVQPGKDPYNGLGIGIASYELDFFGRVRSLESSALETYLASEEAQRAARLSLMSSVANAWLTLCSDQAVLKLTKDTVSAYAESLELIKLKLDAGVASDMEFYQARHALENAQSKHAQFLRQVAQDQNALQLLVGHALPQDLPAPGKIEDAILSDVSPGLPSEVLLRRPDILAAEHRLMAANANIGAARAAFFPSVRLTAFAGTASLEFSNLFEAGTGTWSFVPQITLPIFTGGRLSANLDYAQVKKDIQVAEYEKAIQAAFREVSDGLAARGTFHKQLDAERNMVESSRQYLKLAQLRYDEGVDPYLTVLDAQRASFSAEQQFIRSRLNQLVGEITLYKALGGGAN